MPTKHADLSLPTSSMSVASALALLERLGAPERLLRHHQLVVEAAHALVDGLQDTCHLPFDAAHVVVGAALHDAGKIVHPEELFEPGSLHEAAGERLMVTAGVAPELARFCRTHGRWAEPGATIEDLLVALADHLWRGRRDEALERRANEAISATTGRPSWEVFDVTDALFARIAAAGDERLARS